MSEGKNGGKRPNLIQVVLSVLGAAFGVQSEKTRRRDFEHGKPTTYIVAGLIFTVLFVLTLVGVVSAVIN